MGTGTKIGIILIMILVVVVIANLLDSEVQRGPTAEQQVTGKNSRFAPTLKQPLKRSVKPSATDQRGAVRPVQERRLAANGTTEAPEKRVTKPLVDPVAPVTTTSPAEGQVQPAVGKLEEAGVIQATAVIRGSSETSSVTRRPVARTPVKKTSSSPTMKTITVQTGDSLWTIAARHLGSGLR
ncbi:MAG: hypothetical protein AAEJ04_02055, partial [Planctomycetota bacterium]